MSDIDRLVATTARAVIDRHGLDAGFVASVKAAAKLSRGDTDGARVWREVQIEIERLQAARPKSGRHCS